METSKKVSYFFGVVLLILFCVFLFVGLGTINANLTGDYFIGYMVLGIGCLISSVILFVTARFQPLKEKPTENAE